MLSAVTGGPRFGDSRLHPFRWHLMISVVALMIGLAGCAGNSPPVSVFASRADWEILGGHWRGSYTMSAATRRGLIDFRLSSNGEQASGDVLMIAEGARVPYRPYAPGDPRSAPIDAAYTQLLTIKFVQAEQGQVMGTIASYWDPDRTCQASATFFGMILSDAIDGTFTSTCEDGVRQVRGKWEVTRQRVTSR